MVVSFQVTNYNNHVSILNTNSLGLYIFTQPLRLGRIWHKVNFFEWSLTGLNSEFMAIW